MGPIVLAVDASTAALWPDDQTFAAALRARGADPTPLVWGSPVEPNAVVVVRSTWDYVERPDEFASWLDHLDVQRATVVNPTELLRWNAHKRYLLQLADHGVPVVPTELVRRATEVTLDEIAHRRAWDDVVVKPAVGGSARLTVHAARAGRTPAAEHFERLIAAEDVLVQPFVASVLDAGETSVIAIDGEPTAAVVKRPTDGEWRVQSDFGGTAERVELTDDLRTIAENAIAAVPTIPAYARVDVLPMGEGWRLLELELIEPELFFPLAPEVAERLADLVVARASRRDDA